MSYKIYYKAIFTKKEGHLCGYEMLVRESDFSSIPFEDFEVLEMTATSKDEFIRFEKMLRSQKSELSKIAFVDKHPLEILRYLRGEKAPVNKTVNWEAQIDRWVVNLRGQRV